MDESKSSPKKLRPPAQKVLFTDKNFSLPKQKRRGYYDRSSVKLPKTPVTSSPTKTTALMLKKKACQRRSPVKTLPKSVAVDPGVSSCIATGQAQLQEKKDEGCLENDQVQLMDLMAACTTIRYEPKKVVPNQEQETKSKTERKKMVCLSLFEYDILQDDPKKDERDIAYARDYFRRVKLALSEEPDRFEKFLLCLNATNKDNGNPVQLYKEVSEILHDHQELLNDFAAFLFAHQAVECGCFLPYLQYHQLREFLRQFEIYCENSNSTFQGTLKKIAQLLTTSQEDISFREKLSSVLKNFPNVLDESIDYFLDRDIPKSCYDSDGFEDVDFEMSSSGKECGFEELTLPTSPETYNTKLCTCSCHQDGCTEEFEKRKKHCFDCSLMLEDGIPVLRVSKNLYYSFALLYPDEEKEKAKREKRKLARLALAKAKAQCSKNVKGGKLNKSKRKTKRVPDKKRRQKREQKTQKQTATNTNIIQISDEKSQSLHLDTTKESDSDTRDSSYSDFIPIGLEISAPKGDQLDLRSQKDDLMLNNVNVDMFPLSQNTMTSKQDKSLSSLSSSSNRAIEEEEGLSSSSSVPSHFFENDVSESADLAS